MVEPTERAVAVVGIGAILPDAPDAATFWENVKEGRYSITEVPEDRWDPGLYYHEDPNAPAKTYSTIGGWVREWEFEPLEWRLPIPPKVTDAMDLTQQWTISAVRQTLANYGYPDRPLDPDRTAVVLGNAMGGDQHYMTALGCYFPEYADELSNTPSFAALPDDIRATILTELENGVRERFPGVTEDTMPGELANIIAGRIANLYDFHGPNFVVDAACASAMAAIDAAVEGLENGDYDAVITGGVDANMSASTFIKFCKIGALSNTGTRPFGEGSDGFVMGEGAAIFLLKRLADAERDGDHIYAVLRGIGGASDGKGKGITAPNPVGQRLAVERAWKNAGSVPDEATYIEGHGTSTRVGDVVEVEALSEVFSGLGLRPGTIPLGSVKSNIGHLKGGAGAAGMLKAIMALDSKTLPPTLNAETPNQNIDFESSPLYVNTDLREWKAAPDKVRKAGVSAFGFGGTNFHIVLEEYIPGRIRVADRRTLAASAAPPPGLKDPLRGALVVGAEDDGALATKLEEIRASAAAGSAPPIGPPAEKDLRSPVRVAVDYGDAAELAGKLEKALGALGSGNEVVWDLLGRQGVYYGSGPAHQVAFLYTGQGSQYVNMLAGLRASEPIVAAAFDEADRALTSFLDRPLSEYVFIDPDDAGAMAEAEGRLMQTAITQPAVLTTDLALTRLLDAYGIRPDMVMGHSLGEYGALVAAGALPFADAMEAVAARGREMGKLGEKNVGAMAAVFAPLADIEAALEGIDGYVVVANYNSTTQAVIGGDNDAVAVAVEQLRAAGATAVELPVSHAFHTEIVSPASEPLKQVLQRLHLEPPSIPIVANVDGEFYPMAPQVTPQMIDILGRQIASPVQFVKGLETLYDAGARVFVEVGPKRALQGFAEDVLGDRGDVISLFTNHPKASDAEAFNRALCGLYAAGHGVGTAEEEAPPSPAGSASAPPAALEPAVSVPAPAAVAPTPALPAPVAASGDGTYLELGKMFAEFLDRGYEVYRGAGGPSPAPRPAEPVVVTGASLGLPGRKRVFDDSNIQSILHGDQYIDAVPVKLRQAMVDHNITRLVKSDGGGGRFESIDSQSDVIKLAAQRGELDLTEEFGFPGERVVALDIVTQLAIGAGIDALRDAGVPLTRHYKTTTVNSKLPDRWMLPEPLRDETGVIFASAFPGYDALVDEITRYEQDRARRDRLAALEHLRSRISDDDPAVPELDHMIRETEAELEADPYVFDRRFLFKVLSMGHSQFAEYIGARGPNTQINAACASTTQAVGMAEDWITTGRCRRVIIVSADDVTGDHLMGWIGSGFLATGAAATDDVVEDAALPFDINRHGLLLGMGGAAIVVERADAARERGLEPICEVLGAETANSAFHGTRLDVDHIRFVMEDLIAGAEQRWGIHRHEIAPKTVFVSHETYTPARGGSAQAEIDALNYVFGDSADRIVIANTKGFTGHPMGVGIEDVLAIKSLETGLVPPIPNLKEVDPEFGTLNLSRGGAYPIQYALRLGAGFGSQISVSLMRVNPWKLTARPEPHQLGFRSRISDEAAWARWLSDVSGIEGAEVEIERRTLRIKDGGPPARAASAPAAVAAPAAAPHAAIPAAPVVPPPEPSAATPVAPAPVPAAVAAEPVTAATDPVAAKVLEVVAAETGYPPDMLDLDLDLEADLGIDTVKQAETFAAIRDAYGIERDDNLALRDYPTLASVIAFVYERAPGLEPPPATPAAAPTAADTPATPTVEVPAGDDEAAHAYARRRAIAVLRPDLDHCKRTGVTIDAGSKVLVMSDDAGVGTALANRLEQRGADVLLVADAPEAADLLARIDEWAGGGRVQGVYWLPALDSDPTDPDLAAWREALRRRVKLLHATARHLYDALGAEGAFLVAGTRLGGRHGYDENGAHAPLGGAVTGFVKTLKRERPGALAKAVDFGPSRKTAALADLLIAETEKDPGIVEVGYAAGRRWTVGLTDVPWPDEPGTDELGPDATVVVTGAAGSIVSAITADIARAAGGGTFHLLDLAAPPDPADPDIEAFGSDRDGLKRTLFERLQSGGERATPALVEKELAGIERLHAANAAIRAIEAAGGAVHYHQVDLRDGEAMSEVTAAIAAEGDLDLVLHAGGLEISRLLPDKEPPEFDLVFDVKADGWFNLMSGLRGNKIGTAVVFSSIAGRFGNAGQADYSAANDLLCKSATALPGTRGLALDWTAWGDIGMATRGSIPTVMKAAGIDMLPATTGIPIVRLETAAGGPSREMVVAGELGVLTEEWDPDGGVDPATFDGAGSVMVGTVTGTAGGIVVRTILDPTQQPFLYDHRIDDTPVLPGVMGVEAFAETARTLFPDLPVAAVEGVDFLAPFKFYRDEPREVTVTAAYRLDGDDVVADCRLIGSRRLPNQAEPQVTVHFTGSVRLGAMADLPQRTVPEATGSEVGSDDVYRIYFHGPAYRVLDRAWEANGEVAGAMTAALGANHVPAGSETLCAPRLVELCFQTAGVWEIGTTGTMALPAHIDRLVPGGEQARAPIHAVVRPTGTGFDAVVIDGAGSVVAALEGYRTVRLPGSLPGEAVGPLRTAMQPDD